MRRGVQAAVEQQEAENQVDRPLLLGRSDQGKTHKGFFKTLKKGWTSVVKPGTKAASPGADEAEASCSPAMGSISDASQETPRSEFCDAAVEAAQLGSSRLSPRLLKHRTMHCLDDAVEVAMADGCDTNHRAVGVGELVTGEATLNEASAAEHVEENLMRQVVEKPCNGDMTSHDAPEVNAEPTTPSFGDSIECAPALAKNLSAADKEAGYPSAMQSPPQMATTAFDETDEGGEVDDDREPVQRANSEPEARQKSQMNFQERSLSDRWQKVRPGFCRYLRLYRRKVEELARRSISVERLLHFYHEVVIKTFNMDPNALTEDVVQDVIIPMTEEDAVSWVDYLERNTEYVDTTPIVLTSAKSRPFFTSSADPSVEEPTTHVVHAWKMRFVDLLAAILHDASNGKTRKLGESYEDACRIYGKVLHKPYWICCFCINQHLSICHEPRFKCRCGSRKFDEAMPQCEYDKFAAVAQALHHRGGGMLLALERELQSLSRAWCVDEVHYALATGMDIKPSFSTLPGFCSLREFVCEVRRCEARPTDKERILKKIQIGTGIPAFNDRVTNFLQREARLLMDAARNRSRSISVTRRRRSSQ